ncbi:hypothetical protein Daesc_002717 [Daldinia eschscholtzii]|uniref:Dolichyl-diphosphooligosaccharide--protein glycosyltransferase subunit 4 n=1 Tax=Daldinia eschscholtzii TaxID=292717 RepID=A0AAX6MRR1_9PEZI
MVTRDISIERLTRGLRYYICVYQNQPVRHVSNSHSTIAPHTAAVRGTINPRGVVKRLVKSFSQRNNYQSDPPQLNMISDDDLYTLAIFLGSVAMILIVLYHFFEVNSQEDSALSEKAAKSVPSQQPAVVGKQPGGTK